MQQLVQTLICISSVWWITAVRSRFISTLTGLHHHFWVHHGLNSSNKRSVHWKNIRLIPGNLGALKTCIQHLFITRICNLHHFSFLLSQTEKKKIQFAPWCGFHSLNIEANRGKSFIPAKYQSLQKKVCSFLFFSWRSNVVDYACSDGYLWSIKECSPPYWKHRKASQSNSLSWWEKDNWMARMLNRSS